MLMSGVTASVPGHNFYSYIKFLGPIAWWRLGETSGTTMVDEMGTYNGTYFNNPSLNQPGLVAANSNAAVLFNGTDEYAGVPSLVLPQVADFTFQCWFTAPALQSLDNWNTIIGDENSSSGMSIRLFEDDTNSNGLLIYLQKHFSSNNAQFWTAPGTITSGTTYFFSAVYDGTANTYDLFLDGVEQTADSEQAGTGSESASTAGETNIGRIPHVGGVQYATATVIDEAMIFDKKLTSTEISNINSFSTV